MTTAKLSVMTMPDRIRQRIAVYVRALEETDTNIRNADAMSADGGEARMAQLWQLRWVQRLVLGELKDLLGGDV